MITGRCIVKVEYQKEEWPEIFAAVPKIGDYIYSSNGLELKVTKIVHGTKPIVRPYKPLIEPVIFIHLE